MVHTAELGNGVHGHGESRHNWQHQQDVEAEHD